MSAANSDRSWWNKSAGMCYVIITYILVNKLPEIVIAPRQRLQPPVCMGLKSDPFAKFHSKATLLQFLMLPMMTF